MQAVGAFLHHPLRRPVGKIRDIRIDLVRSDLRLGEVEPPGPIGAGRLAITAADAPIVVDHRDPVGLLPGRLDRADLDARRVGALVALDRHVILRAVGHQGRIVMVVGSLHVDAPLLHLKHADVLDFRRPRLVVLLDAGMHALAAADAAAEVQTVDEFDAVQRRRIGELRLDLVARLDRLGDPGEDPLLVLGGHLLVVLLEELRDRRDVVAIQVGQRRRRGGHGRRARQGHHAVGEETSPRQLG